MAAWWNCPGLGDCLPPDELPDLTEQEQVERAARQAAYDIKFGVAPMNYEQATIATEREVMTIMDDAALAHEERCWFAYGVWRLWHAMYPHTWAERDSARIYQLIRSKAEAA